MSRYALIKNNLVESVIVGDSDFIKNINDYDAIIDVSNLSVSPGDSYYPDTAIFISNTSQLHDIPVDKSALHLNLGTESGFPDFNISKYTVKYKDGNITIGCKTYPAIGVLDTLHKMLIQKEKTTTIFSCASGNPSHGKFDITWEDAQAIYDALIKVKLQ